MTDEEKAAKKDQAQQVLDKIKAQEDIAGADVDSLAKKWMSRLVLLQQLTAQMKTMKIPLLMLR